MKMFFLVDFYYSLNVIEDTLVNTNTDPKIFNF